MRICCNRKFCIFPYSSNCTPACSGHSLVFWRQWVINILSQYGCDQSLWLEKPWMFTIPACVLNSRLHQPPNIKGCFSLSLSHYVIPLSFYNFLLFFSFTWSVFVTPTYGALTPWPAKKTKKPRKTSFFRSWSVSQILIQLLLVKMAQRRKETGCRNPQKLQEAPFQNTTSSFGRHFSTLDFWTLLLEQLSDFTV